MAGLTVAYVRAHRGARRLAVAAPAAPKVATLSSQQTPWLPAALALLVGVGASSLAAVHAMGHFEALPEKFPTHFNLQGRADGWTTTSMRSVMMLPAISAILGAGMAMLTMMISRAKRVVRVEGLGISMAGQTRFRLVLTWVVSGVSMLTSLLLATIAFESVEVALGRQEGLSPLITIMAVSLGILPLGAIAYLVLRVGEGGAHVEAPVADAPLSDGLADNRRWKMGVFYVNAEDPSLFVEHRFGIGYTVNFGNRRALWLFMGLLVFIAVMATLPWLM
jgi:uncharacterized membrane protein